VITQLWLCWTLAVADWNPTCWSAKCHGHHLWQLRQVYDLVKIVGPKIRPKMFCLVKSETCSYGVLLIYLLVSRVGDYQLVGNAFSHTRLCMPYPSCYKVWVGVCVFDVGLYTFLDPHSLGPTIRHNF